MPRIKKNAFKEGMVTKKEINYIDEKSKFSDKTMEEAMQLLVEHYIAIPHLRNPIREFKR